MAELEGLMAQLREEAAVRGAEWLQETIAAALQGSTREASGEERSGTRASRSRPPERFSPDRMTSAQRHSGSLSSRLPGGPPAKRAAGRERASGRAPPAGREERHARDPATARPQSRRHTESASPAPRMTAGSAAIASAALHGGIPGPSSSAAGDRQRGERSRAGLTTTGVEASRAEVAHTGPGKAVRKSTGGFTARRRGRMASNAAAAVHIPGGPPSDSEEEPGRSGREEESGSEEEAAPLPRRMGQKRANGRLMGRHLGSQVSQHRSLHCLA